LPKAVKSFFVLFFVLWDSKKRLLFDLHARPVTCTPDPSPARQTRHLHARPVTCTLLFERIISQSKKKLPGRESGELAIWRTIWRNLSLIS